MRVQLLIFMLFASAAIPCNSHARNTAVSASGTPTIRAHGVDRLPSETIRDLASYADALSYLQITGETASQLDKEAREAGEGYVGRTVTATVERTLWVADGGVAPESAITILTAGWWLKDGQRMRVCVEDAMRLEVGGRYLVPLVHFDEGWGPLSGAAVALAPGSKRPDGECDGGNALSKELALVDSNTLIERLANTPRDPLVERLRNLRPVERYRAASAGR
jgi:hypothetical protein